MSCSKKHVSCSGLEAPSGKHVEFSRKHVLYDDVRIFESLQHYIKNLNFYK